MSTESTLKQSVAVLGSTGPVGQKVISLLENHALFSVEEVSASDLNAGRLYGEAVKWKNEFPLPKRVAELRLKSPFELKSRLVISALPAEQALETEPELAAASCSRTPPPSAWIPGCPSSSRR